MCSVDFLNHICVTIMYTRDQILNILKREKATLQKQYSLSELGLFGSYARGDNHSDSDIDILVDFSERIDRFEFIRLAHYFEDIFNSKIDLVSRDGIKTKYLPFVEKSLIHV